MSSDSKFPATLATASIALAGVSVLALLGLHVVSPEYAPSWHMVSEYGYGPYGWLLRVFFFAWGTSSLLAAAAIVPSTTGVRARVGAAFVALSGVGAICGGLFDIRHDLHGMAFGLGVPTLPIGALLLISGLAALAPAHRTRLRVSSHATWLSIVAMAASMALFIASLKAAGAFHPESKEVLKELPAGVTSVSGYANRLLVLAYLAWNVVAGLVVRTRPG